MVNFNIEDPQKEAATNLCEVLDRIERKGWIEGERKGRAEGETKLAALMLKLQPGFLPGMAHPHLRLSQFLPNRLRQSGRVMVMWIQ